MSQAVYHHLCEWKTAYECTVLLTIYCRFILNESITNNRIIYKIYNMIIFNMIYNVNYYYYIFMIWYKSTVTY